MTLDAGSRWTRLRDRWMLAAATLGCMVVLALGGPSTAPVGYLAVSKAGLR
jgi:hypothetical protein